MLLKPGAAQRIRDQLYHAPLTPRAPTSSSPIHLAPTVPPVTTATATPVLTSTAETSQRYVVQQGDTLFSLARRYGVTVEDIQQANNLADDDIYVGQQLIIPAP